MAIHFTLEAGTEVTDGYFVYVVLADSLDGFVTVSLRGHRLRVPKSELYLN